MSDCYRIALNLSLFLLISNAYAELHPLTPHQSDAIIAQREQSKADQKAKRIAELDKATVKSEGRGTLPNGQQVIIREVEPPVNLEAYRALRSSQSEARVTSALAKTPPSAPLFQPTPEELAWMEQQQQIGQHRVLMFSCTVFDHSVTRVSWSYDAEKFVAYANADFDLLRGVMNISTETDAYDFFMGIGDATRANNPYPNEIIPTASNFSPDRSEYILIEGTSDNLEAIAGLNALLAHYDANLPELKTAQQRRTALGAAQKRYDAKHPKEPDPFIMQFWVPEKSPKRSGVDFLSAEALAKEESPRPNLSRNLAAE